MDRHDERSGATNPEVSQLDAVLLGLFCFAPPVATLLT